MDDREAIDRLQAEIDAQPDLKRRIKEIMAAKLDSAMAAHAQHGDTPDASRYLLKRLAEHLTGGPKLPAEAVEMLAAALLAVGEGEDANRALGLKTGRGVKPKTLEPEPGSRTRRWLLIREIEETLQQNPGLRAYRNDVSEAPSACSMVAARHGIPEKTVNDYWSLRSE